MVGEVDKKAEELCKERAAWVRSLQTTRWLEGVQMLLETTQEIVELIKQKEPVLVNHSDHGS